MKYKVGDKVVFVRVTGNSSSELTKYLGEQAVVRGIKAEKDFSSYPYILEFKNGWSQNFNESELEYAVKSVEEYFKTLTVKLL